jgi:cytochrome b pre-mRNA-processing protein 3
MFSIYKSHNNDLYNKLVQLSRNIFFYKEILLKDNFETRINLIFLHFSILLIIFKVRKKEFSQKIFDNIFLNIEYHIRELGYGDVTVNKKMKTLTRIFYDILIKINKSNSEDLDIDIKILKTYFVSTGVNNPILIDNLCSYFNNFYNFCFELKTDNVLKGQINFKY